jgi:hypothetical protein
MTTDRPFPDDDAARVRELLGREPRGRYEVVVRDRDGDPVVLRNAPLLDDGTPMPTRYWLIGPDEIRRVGRLESEGGVDRAEADVDPAELAEAHERYATERDAEIPDDHEGPRPSGGVGGTRVGVKCLHAHWAWHLAGGDDPIGRWIERELARSEQLTLRLGTGSLDVVWASTTWSFPVGLDRLRTTWLDEHDPPRPAALTNALGEVADHLDDLVRAHPEVTELSDASVGGDGAWTIARLEAGVDHPPSPFVLDRDTAEEIFRLAVTEARADRLHNPGLPSSDVDTVVAALCTVVSAMRRLGLGRVTIAEPGEEPNGTTHATTDGVG